ncbi:MAG: zinc ribbon domain-containing protein [Oscillospiraceae bacterium]|nr:zinc ribbon domain-containing protein [Oscillospiraceae bacterium]
MFCQNCRTQIADGAKFCPVCGAAVQAAVMQRFYAGNGAVRQGIPAPGFSDRVNDPEILAAIGKSRRAAMIFAMFIVPLPLIGFLIYSSKSDKMETSDALKYGAIVSAVFLLFAVFSFFKSRSGNSYEGVVTDKKEKETYRHRNSSDDRELTTQYTTFVQTSEGKLKKIVEYEGSQIWAYNYLNIGDRFRYHPQFHFPYERYDKASGPCIYCVSCGRKNPVEADRCQKCKIPLLK